MTALARANEVRVGIAAIKAELKAGSRDFSDTILRPPPCVESARVYDLLVQLPRMGSVKARFLLRCFDMTDATRIRHLSPLRRRKLVLAVEQRVWLRSLSVMRQVARGGGERPDTPSSVAGPEVSPPQATLEPPILPANSSSSGCPVAG